MVQQASNHQEYCLAWVESPNRLLSQNQLTKYVDSSAWTKLAVCQVGNSSVIINDNNWMHALFKLTYEIWSKLVTVPRFVSDGHKEIQCTW